MLQLATDLQGGTQPPQQQQLDSQFGSSMSLPMGPTPDHEQHAMQFNAQSSAQQDQLQPLQQLKDHLASLRQVRYTETELLGKFKLRFNLIQVPIILHLLKT